ncbi:tRNA (cytosine(32)/uridine(32)-2'-O)-methyltransferase TrmJ [Thiohalophilus thiocyanatoxydans]|uniref:tRNA (cytidine/uridine-2'-O-)-methyltransferase TrmJ n=1 Tax=Thiohalophilus thiocyanatoxydans TaxID=381308 RepID=A0A4R8ILQ1_9GAMM|nr:tRNA (cytosine(32)/uridine(32)-2'-O)-methyltransferase TrmJ [Thiohalophilus thiocyanatoxydans]TDY01726.1 tRNA (cytidine32/uridine32-2'-O)-methyltransferase [Thiohalophilus thiocyanatoxydans]
MSAKQDDVLNARLSRVRVVLVSTSHPGNIGAVARAMKNMGLTQLVLVNPAEFPSGEARARASGANDILEQAQVVSSMESAVAGCAVVLGASARLRSIPWPSLDPRAAADRVLEVVESADAALVFGRENNGLSNDELDRCNYLVHIPANPDYSSLNIAAATQVLVYELRMSLLEQTGRRDNRFHSDQPRATADELERLYEHLQQTLTELDFLKPSAPRQIMRRLRRLFGRAELDRMEINILRGILSAVQSRSRGEKTEESER